MLALCGRQEAKHVVSHRADPRPGELPLRQRCSRSLHDASVEGVEVKAVYGAFTEHVVFIVVETDDIDPLHRFLVPGMKVCTTRIRPVSDHAVPHFDA